jgi:hypothetical protein
VIRYLLDVQADFKEQDEEARLHAWAEWARPGDYLALNVPGFGLAGFQYLRMLFNAQTAKPDVHISIDLCRKRSGEKYRMFRRFTF